MLCVQESVQDSVVARLRLRMAGMKCVALRSDEDRVLVDAAIQEAQQQGATVRLNRREMLGYSGVQIDCLTLVCLLTFTVSDLLTTHFSVSRSQLIQSCTAPPSGAQYPPTVLLKAAPASPFVVNPPPGPLLPLMTFRSNTEAVTLGEEVSLYVDA